MKWIALAGLLIAIPLMTAFLRQQPKAARYAWMLIGFLPFVSPLLNLEVAPISWAQWPGITTGAEITLLDAVALSVLLSRKRSTMANMPLRYVFIAYLLMVLASALQGNAPTAALFYAWQLARVFLVFLAVGSIAMEERGPRTLLQGMALGLCLHGVLAIQDWAAGAVQTGGGFGHQNYLGLVSHFVAFPLVALLLAGDRSRLFIAATVAAIVVAILTASRATIGLAGLGYVLVLLLSLFRSVTTRKAAVAGLMGCMLVAAVPLALGALERRFAQTPIVGNYDERAAFERAARQIISDHPFGVGANQYVVVANTEGYSSRAGVVWNSRSRAAHVHHVYLLVAAETGYLGLAAFLALLGRALWLAGIGGFRKRNSSTGDLLLGLTVSIAIASLHSLYEWVLLTAHAQYILAVNLGLIAGLTKLRRTAKEPEAERRPKEAPLARFMAPARAARPNS